MSADLLRRAATVLRDPDRCNTNAHDLPVADVLDLVAHHAADAEYVARAASNEALTHVEPAYSPLAERVIDVARAILGETA